MGSEDGSLIADYALDGKVGGTSISWSEILQWQSSLGVGGIPLDRLGEAAQKWLPEDSEIPQFVADALKGDSSRPRLVNFRPERFRS